MVWWFLYLKDEERATRKIADYLELPVTPENAARIARDCGISNVKERMKTHQISFLFRKGILFHYFYSAWIQHKQVKFDAV